MDVVVVGVVGFVGGELVCYWVGELVGDCVCIVGDFVVDGFCLGYF